MITISSNAYEDQGSTFENIDGAYGSVVSCHGCLIKMKDTILMNIKAISGGLISLVGHCNVVLDGIQGQNISAESKGGLLIEQQFQSESGNLTQSFIILKNTQLISNFYAQEGGLFYLFHPTTSLLIQNVMIQNISSAISGGLFSVLNAYQIQIENSRILDIFSNNAAFIISTSNFLNLIIRNTKIICDQQYDQKLVLKQYTQNFGIYTESVAYFVLQNTKSIVLSNNIIEFCGNQNRAGVFSIQKTALSDEKSVYKYNSGQYGGVISAQESSIKLISSEFYNNLGKTGAVINAISYSNLTFRFCTFQANNATIQAGVLYLATQCSLNIYASLFLQNLAYENSVLEIQSTNLNQDVVISKSEFKENQAQKNTMSILYSNSKKIVDYQQSYKMDETTGSFIFLIFDVNILIDNCQFVGGSSNYGGVLYISGDSVVNIKNSRFINNQATAKGGVIYSSGFKSIYIGEQSTFIDNTAVDNGEDIYITNSYNTISFNRITNQGSGGAIYYTCNSQSLNCIMKFIGSLIFESNKADLQGGAIFWDQLEPITNQSQISFINNKAHYYGDNLACYSQNLRAVTQTQYLNKMIQIGLKTQDDFDLRILSLDQNLFNHRELQNLLNQRSGGSIPEIYMAMMDKYGQIVGSDFKSKVRVNIDISNLNENQTKYPPILEGSNSFDIIGGIAVISDIVIVGTPGISYQLLFSSDGIDLSKKSNKEVMQLGGNSNLDLDLQINLRECLIGEQFTIAGKCQQCEGSFSLVQMTEPGNCEVCPQDKAKCISGAIIGPLPGYWRKNNETKIFTQCLYEFACLGMIPPKNSLVGECLKGYQGILCADCEYGFSRSNAYQCSKCPDKLLNTFRLLTILAAVTLLIVLMIRSTLNGAMDTNNVTIEIRGKIMSSLVILLFLAHPSLVTNSFYNFNCKEIDGEFRVLDDLEIVCWSSVHNKYSYFVALPSIIVWGLGIPFFALIILINKRKKLETFDLRQRFGFLFRGYRKDYYFWEIVIMYRKIMIVFTAVFITVQFHSAQ
ncbi:UNKNOWN [Stylonychia lemnae]|uniref:Transmembrane protein n=1 Tax=Stylonychia lemnae TaxID=5949 RepID=A0A078ANX2_STYLE|nr:UNKNOWN [Stylonychia lemnae]|eukprot:CDW84065.1 UNKNOWN [Stylonychia lemnae]